MQAKSFVTKLGLSGLALSAAIASTAAVASASVDKRAAALVPAQYKSGISVAVQSNIPPLNSLGAGGADTGLDPALLGALSKELGVKITVHPVTFENLILGLNSGKYDFVADTTVTSAREKTYDMQTYLDSSYSVGTLKSASKLGTSETALCGMDVGIVTGEVIVPYITNTIDAECKKAGKPTVQTTEFNEFSSAVLGAQSQQVQAIVVDTGTFGYFLKGKGGANFEYNGPSRMELSPAGYSFLKKKNAALGKAVGVALKTLIRNGEYGKIFAKYGQDSAEVTKTVMNPTVG